MKHFTMFDLQDGQYIGMDRYCRCKVSYYTNIHVRREGNTFILRSYWTDVCEFNPVRGVIRFYGAYSRSTVAHINAFMSQMTTHYGSMNCPMWEIVNRVILNEKFKSCTEFFDLIRMIDFKRGIYSVLEKRSGETEYSRHIYRY